jgi:hypothetical protein
MLKKPSLFGLMALIAYIAVGMAGIRSNEAIWAVFVMYLTVFILCSATVVAIDRRGAWAGFAVFGWAYFWIFQPNAAVQGPTSVSMEVAARLVVSFTDGDLPYYSLSSGLSLSSVAVGFLGVFVGWLIGRESKTSHHDSARPDCASRL